MKKILFLFLLMMTIRVGWAQQQIPIFSENFESAISFDADTGVVVGTQTGPNKWIINNQYNGGGTYPNTLPQDSLTAGTIFGAPFSNYLHIHDTTAAPGVANANFKPTAASDRFIYTSQGFCTHGMSEVILTFFYTAVGHADAYGEIYYSKNNGPWIKTGKAKYNNQNFWKYEIINDTAFVDAFSLRIGFRWVNNNSNQPATVSFGIDDILVVGTYDDVNDPVEISISQLIPNPVCQQTFLTIGYTLSDVLCAGTYRIFLSNSTGNFINGISLGIFGIGAGVTSGFISGMLPPGLPAGTCYKVRIERVSPAPTIIGTASVCFTIQTCPNTIITNPPVAADSDPLNICSGSAIDIPFFSTGVYTQGNSYIAQLSDSSGSFANPEIIGSSPDIKTYDPALGSPPGSVGGTLPDVPAGCNYFIRIVSTNPTATGSLYGPFCIRNCDIETNDRQDISVCVSQTVGVDTALGIIINYWDSAAIYQPGNQFVAELRDMKTFGMVNSGGLGIVFDTVSTTMILHVPGRDSLLMMGIAPGAYYLRIVATNSSTPGNIHGTLIRLTIGAPDDVPPTIVGADTVGCNNSLQPFLITNLYNPDSDYTWTSNAFIGPNNPDGTLEWPDNPLWVHFVNSNPDDYVFYVQETNFGCPGPLSDPYTLIVITAPLGNITGPTKICKGDTVKFHVPYLAETYYDWTPSWGTIIDTSNNEIFMTFDSAGTASIFNYAVNECGSKNSLYNFQVVEQLKVAAGDDREICAGEPVILTAESAGFDNELITTFQSGTVTTHGNMFDLIAEEDLIITGFDCNFSSTASTDFEFYYREGSHIGFETDKSAWVFHDAYGGLVPNSPGTATPLPLGFSFELKKGDTMAFYITTTNNTNLRYTNGTNQGDVYKSDGILTFIEGTANMYSFGSFLTAKVWNGIVHYNTFNGLSYSWNTGDTSAQIIAYPQLPQEFTVYLRDSTGCGNWDTVFVNVKPSPDVTAGEDRSVCYGGSVELAGASTHPFNWEPLEDIEQSQSLSPIVAPSESRFYVLSATDSTVGCTGRDTVWVEVFVEESDEVTRAFCEREAIDLQLPETAGAKYTWNTGAESSTISVNAPGVYTGEISYSDTRCKAQYIYEVLTKDCDKLIKPPSAFTPNLDGSNDYFTVFGENIAEYEIRIFNRWGEQVYYSNDASELNDLSRGWNGMHKGVLQNLGTYVYVINAKDIFGLQIRKQGNLTLVR